MCGLANKINTMNKKSIISLAISQETSEINRGYNMT